MRTAELLPASVLRRKAVVYVRQSTPGQVQANLESQRRQYELIEVARQYGFAEVEIIDDDLGLSASGSVARPGFDRLVAQLCAGSVGAVVCLEASRLARNGRDWHHLLELCGLVKAQVIDLDGQLEGHGVRDVSNREVSGHHRHATVERIGQSEFDALFTGPYQPGEGLFGFLEPIAAAFAHRVDELRMNVIEHVLRIFALLFVERRKRVHEPLVVSCSEQASLDTELLHGIGKSETVHQHADRADDALDGVVLALGDRHLADAEVLERIDGLDMTNTGTFWHADGTALPW